MSRVMCRVAALCCVAGALVMQPGACTTHQGKVDAYVDAIVADANSQIESNKLEPLPLKNFAFKIEKTGITNRDVKTNVTLGRFEGLTKMRRRGSCTFALPDQSKKSEDSVASGNVSVSCNVTLAGIKAFIINGEFKGDTLTGTVKQFSTVTVIDTADLNVQFVGRPGLKGHLKLTVLDTVVLTTSFASVEERPNLNKERLTAFTNELNKNLAHQLFSFAKGAYRAFLEIAAERKVIPYFS